MKFIIATSWSKRLKLYFLALCCLMRGFKLIDKARKIKVKGWECLRTGKYYITWIDQQDLDSHH